MKSNCLSTVDITRICVDGQCINENKNEKIEEDNEWIVEIEMDDLTLNEMNITEIKTIIIEATGIENKIIKVGYDKIK